MKVKQLIELLEKCDPEFEVNTGHVIGETTNYWVTDVEQFEVSLAYPEGEVLLITSE